ncbi:ribonuclease H-like domain-containing protein [Mycena leptocephala]|nr:ribonuclease H-like domain-containing protein [Mycena leptocephala]
MDSHIMSEQERVRGLQIALHQRERRLTVSFDGGDLKSGEYFYTVHANTADGRSFVLEGIECTGVSHTAEWMANSVMEVMETVGVKHFSGGSSDNTGNTRGCRGLLCHRIPTFLNFPDPNHHLSLTCRDILLLPYFKMPIKVLRGTIKHFNHSKASKKLLEDLALRELTGRGLESIGKTRFATITWSGISLRRNLNPIRTLCVENPGHEYVNSSIFKRPNAVAPATITIPGIQTLEVPIGVKNAKTFNAVGKYLFDQGTVEVKHGIDPILVAFKKKNKRFVKQFKEQFTAYAQGAFPYNTPLGKMRPLDWWRKHEGSENGGILASFALKLYSAVPHSMADERTVSVITWMNPALRNLEKVNTIFSFAQIRGWYRDEAKQKALSDGTAKTRAAARPFPEIKFYNIEREIHSVDDDVDDKMVPDDDAPDSEDEFETMAPQTDWLDLPREIFASSDALDLELGEVNLDSTLLEDLLAETAVPMSGTGTRSTPADVFMGMADVDEDNDEETGFELGHWA